MNYLARLGRSWAVSALWMVVAGGIAVYFVDVVSGEERITLFPRGQNGATLRYESYARLERDVKTKSNVATMLEPKPLRAELASRLRLSIQDLHVVDKRPMMAAETELEAEEPTTAGATSMKWPKVSFTVGGDGSLTRAEGLEDLSPEQRIAWQFWVAQFAFGWTIPASGVKPGEKWKTEEVEQSPSPIANLAWERETTYVQNDTCPILKNEQCAVFLTKATLKQKSNPKNTTPEDYERHELKTSGNVSGANETVAYISLRTGLLMRATEDVHQSLDVTIAKVDGSNQVQYRINVTSHIETTFAPQAGVALR